MDDGLALAMIEFRKEWKKLTGIGITSNSLVSQRSPSKPGSQIQEKVLIPSMHAPLRQGPGAQSSISGEKQ